MSREAVTDILKRLVDDVLQLEKVRLSTGDFKHILDTTIDDYTDEFFEIETASHS